MGTKVKNEGVNSHADQTGAGLRLWTSRQNNDQRTMNAIFKESIAQKHFLVLNRFTKGSNSLILLNYKFKHTHSKSSSASRHYEVFNFRLVGHAATLHVEPDLRLKPVQVRSRRSQS
jgi:hypothetical protein